MKATINGRKLAYDDLGTGPAIVLVNDAVTDPCQLRHQCEALVAEGYRVIVPDLKSLEESLGTPSALQVFGLVGLLKYLGIGRAVFVGVARGSAVLSQLLERFPAKVAGALYLTGRSRTDEGAEKGRGLEADPSEHFNRRLLEYLQGVRRPQRQPLVLSQVA